MIRAAPQSLSRRALLAGLSGAWFAAAAPIAAAAATDRKLVVIIARGGLDGLSLAPPIGDLAYARLRGPIAIPAEAALRIDADFGLHPRLRTLHQLGQAGQVRIAPAAAIPLRTRSHFDAQDVLGSGSEVVFDAATGWLNRALLVGGGEVRGLSVGQQTPSILRGSASVESWSPGPGLAQDQQRLVSTIQDFYAGDGLLGPAFASGLATQEMARTLADRSADAAGVATTAGRFLAAPGGPSAAVLTLDGFDTHSSQGATDGQLAERFETVDQVFAGLRAGLGAHWSKAVVLLVTEFGRTARINGTLGTDHGTAGAVVIAGGALRRGGIVGDWPGLAEPRLLEDRDLAPTLDVRSIFKAALIDHLGLPRRDVDTAVFADSPEAPPVQGLFA